MILIIGMVLGSFILFNAIRRRKLKKRSLIHEEFEQTILENNHSHYQQMQRVEKMQQDSHSGKSEHDPLLDDVTIDTIQSAQVAYLENQRPEQTFVETAKQIEDEFEDLDEMDEDDIDDIVDIEEEAAPKAQDFIALTIMPKYKGTISGNALLTALTRNHFRHGKQKLYHRHVQDNEHLPIMFSVASMAEPGFFEQETIVQKSYPGLLVYMFISSGSDSVGTFEKMLTSARQLAMSLQAELCDSKRIPLTARSIQQYRERVKELQYVHASHRQKETAW